MPNKEEIKKSKKQPDKKSPNSIIRYSGMGLQMAAIMLLGAWAGIKIDKYFNINNNIFTATLTILAVIIAVYLTIKDLIKNK
ncbi:MAG TPA: AtpZ/AtpI family protein [Bacteroidia bacterium]|nr:AtpZ/AtpI family protein [Bacteroidia bacterium]